MTAEGAGTMAVHAATGKGKPTIWRWQERSTRGGADRLFRDVPRGRAFPPVSAEQVAAVVERTLREAPLDVKAGTVIGRCMLRHRAAEFIRFLRVIDKQTPAGLDLHLILDNDAAHRPRP